VLPDVHVRLAERGIQAIGGRALEQGDDVAVPDYGVNDDVGCLGCTACSAASWASCGTCSSHKVKVSMGSIRTFRYASSPQFPRVSAGPGCEWHDHPARFGRIDARNGAGDADIRQTTSVSIYL
jgi:hypothetical protein